MVLKCTESQNSLQSGKALDNLLGKVERLYTHIHDVVYITLESVYKFPTQGHFRSFSVLHNCILKLPLLKVFPNSY